MTRTRSPAERGAMFAKMGKDYHAINRDMSVKAVNTLPDTPENRKEWEKDSRRIDIEGIDTPIKKGETINRKKDISRLPEKKGQETKEMEIKSKSGNVLDIKVTGTQENPIITAKPFEVGGRKIKGVATIQHWKSKGAEEGLLFKDGDVYVQAASDIPKIKYAIEQLPNEKFYAKKIEREVSTDGEKITITEWKFEKILLTKKGTMVSDKEMSKFLDEKKIEKIEIRDAIELWTQEKEPEYLMKQVEMAEWRKTTFDDDEADENLAQAYENAGVPTNLRNVLGYDS